MPGESFIDEPVLAQLYKKINKGIILDKNCIILEGFGNFGYEKSFENLLKKHNKIN